MDCFYPLYIYIYIQISTRCRRGLVVGRHADLAFGRHGYMARLRLARVLAFGRHGYAYGRPLECSPSGGTATPTGGPSGARLRAARMLG